jgi:DNA-binding transcriptional LysR family regulator
MTFDQLMYFIEAAKQEHLGRASKILHVSVSTVSHAIAKIEEELNAQLFQRVGKNVVLTSFGKSFLQRSEKLAREFTQLSTDFGSAFLHQQQRLRVGVSHDFLKNVAGAWGKLSTLNKNLSGEIFSMRSSQVVDEVLNGNLDVGFCLSPNSHPKLEIETIFFDNLVLVVSKHHSMATKLNSNNLSLLSQFPSALPKAFKGIEVCETHPALKKHNINAVENFLFDCYAAGFECLKNDNCWGLFPEYLLNAHPEKVNLKKLSLPKSWRATYNLSAVYLRSKSLISVESQFIQEVKKAYS